MGRKSPPRASGSGVGFEEDSTGFRMRGQGPWGGRNWETPFMPRGGYYRPPLHRLAFSSVTGASFTDEFEEDTPVTTLMRTREAEGYDRLHPATAGLMSGGLAGMAMLAVAQYLGQRYGLGNLVLFFGERVARWTGPSLPTVAWGYLASFAAGGLLGMAFALVTRHLRRYWPLLAWSLIFFPALWVLVRAFVLPRWAPLVAAKLPFGPMALSVLVYAFVFSIQLPLRRRERFPFY